MPFYRSLPKFFWSRLNTIGAFILFLCVTSIAITAYYSDSAEDNAWNQALRVDSPQRKYFQTPANTDTTILSGISGKAGVHSDTIPETKYKGNVVPARTATSKFLKLNVGDVISIKNADGKNLYFRIVRRKPVAKNKTCKDLNTPQKDTTLVNCIYVKKKSSEAPQYVLELVQLNIVPDLSSRNAIMQHES